MATVLIGIDDTDNADSPGTGRLARRLTDELCQRGAIAGGITGHWFLLDQRIPYTLRNRAVCLAIEWTEGIEELKVVEDLIPAWAADGSDPGVCIAAADSISSAVIDWGGRASREVLTMPEANSIAQSSGLRLSPLGGSGQGIIGALASVGLRAEGNQGRFLDLPGLRQLGENVNRAELMRIGVQIEHRMPLPKHAPAVDNPEAIYRTFGWVRPRLMGGKAVWPVEWSDEHDGWIGIDRKKSEHLE